MKLNLDSNQKTGIACSAVILIAAYIFSGLTGAVAVILMGLLFVLPTYLFLSAFKLDDYERWFFSFFLGIGLYAVIAYLVGLVLKSLRVSAMVTFFLMMAVGLAFYIRSRKGKSG